MPSRPLRGTFRPPGDKSVSHRVALFSLLGEGRCTVSNYSDCADCASSLGAVQQLGGGVSMQPDRVVLRGARGRLAATADIDCGNSGTTMRMLPGILAAAAGTYRLDGDDSLRRRPMERVAIPLRLMGARIETAGGCAPLTVHGAALRGITYALPVASAQLKSAVLLAALQAQGTTAIEEPAPSRDHSERLLAAWGARLERHGGTLTVWPGVLRMAEQFTVPGDTSGAAFFVGGASVVPGSAVSARDVLLNPSRTGWIDVLRRMGAAVECRTEADSPEPMGAIHAGFCCRLRACTVAAAEIPNVVDEIPILALVATQAQGVSTFANAGELRVKECDRLAAIETQLTRLGATVRTEGDTLVVTGPTPLRAPADPCDSYGDHRIAMMLRIASLLCEAPLAIRDEACAAVSYPTFAQTFAALTATEAP